MTEMPPASSNEPNRPRRAVYQLMDDIDSIIPSLPMGRTSKNVFMGTLALFRCNRLLRAINNGVACGYGDTVGGNVRTLYETWILGHHVMLGDNHDIEQIWGAARGQGDKLLRTMGKYRQEPIEYPSEMPEPLDGTSTFRRAQMLTARLKKDDPKHAHLPIDLYNTLYRSESHLSVHAGANVLAQYIVAQGDDVAAGLGNESQDHQRHVRMSSYMTAYYASRLFDKAGVDTTELSSLVLSQEY